MKGLETDILIVIIVLIVAVIIVLLFLSGVLKLDLTTLSPV